MMFNALTLLVGQREWYLACKNLYSNIYFPEVHSWGFLTVCNGFKLEFYDGENNGFCSFISLTTMSPLHRL